MIFDFHWGCTYFFVRYEFPWIFESAEDPRLPERSNDWSPATNSLGPPSYLRSSSHSRNRPAGAQMGANLCWVFVKLGDPQLCHMAARWEIPEAIWGWEIIVHYGGNHLQTRSEWQALHNPDWWSFIFPWAISSASQSSKMVVMNSASIICTCQGYVEDATDRSETWIFSRFLYHFVFFARNSVSFWLSTVIYMKRIQIFLKHIWCILHESTITRMAGFRINYNNLQSWMGRPPILRSLAHALKIGLFWDSCLTTNHQLQRYRDLRS